VLSKRSPRLLSTGDQIIRRRWWIAGSIAVLGLITEIVGISMANWVMLSSQTFAVHAIWETSLLVLGMPLSIGVGLSWLERARRQAAQRQVQAVLGERQKISQELHDTLAQQLGYLYLELDALSANPNLVTNAGVQRKLGSLRDIANDAYEQVRTALMVLRPSPGDDLVAELASYAHLVAARADLAVEVTSEGAAQPLPEPVIRRLVYLFREALANVEKHAQAQHVNIRVSWKPESVKVSLSDDGCGFVPDIVSPPGHFGMIIMQEHARDLHAHLQITSQPRAGTQLTIEVPLDASR
jgi:two-component system, NarL family, nitrate/nitrite sensor histidine kinase NarX